MSTLMQSASVNETIHSREIRWSSIIISSGENLTSLCSITQTVNRFQKCIMFVLIGVLIGRYIFLNGGIIFNLSFIIVSSSVVFIFGFFMCVDLLSVADCIKNSIWCRKRWERRKKVEWIKDVVKREIRAKKGAERNFGDRNFWF